MKINFDQQINWLRRLREILLFFSAIPITVGNMLTKYIFRIVFIFKELSCSNEIKTEDQWDLSVFYAVGIFIYLFNMFMGCINLDFLYQILISFIWFKTSWVLLWIHLLSGQFEIFLIYHCKIITTSLNSSLRTWKPYNSPKIRIYFNIPIYSSVKGVRCRIDLKYPFKKAW